jgi:hypothetical protein
LFCFSLAQLEQFGAVFAFLRKAARVRSSSWRSGKASLSV